MEVPYHRTTDQWERYRSQQPIIGRGLAPYDRAEVSPVLYLSTHLTVHPETGATTFALNLGNIYTADGTGC